MSKIRREVSKLAIGHAADGTSAAGGSARGGAGGSSTSGAGAGLSGALFTLQGGGGAGGAVGRVTINGDTSCTLDGGFSPAVDLGCP